MADVYGQDVQTHWSRFDVSARIEEYVLSRVIREQFPDPTAVVADIGGGNGRHAFRLAGEGYAVWLCDVVEEMAADAQQRNASAAAPLACATVADARALPWECGFADAALVLGPMYCLPDQESRRQALNELARILKPGAPALIQYFTRISGLRWILEAAPASVGLFAWGSYLETGVLLDGHIPGELRAHYFSTEDSAVAEVGDAGLTVVDVRGMDGPAPSVGQRNLMRAPRAIVQQWGEIAYHVGGIRDYRSASTHLLLTVQKPTETRK